LPDGKYRIEFASPSIKSYYDINGLDFRGLTSSPRRHMSSWSKSL
jgi:hypothetical protein